MPTTMSAPPRVIVIPRQLEAFFYERLRNEFSGRDDVRVIVDRRVGERRRSREIGGARPSAERRRNPDRRATPPVWSLPEMPYSAS